MPSRYLIALACLGLAAPLAAQVSAAGGSTISDSLGVQIVTSRGPVWTAATAWRISTTPVLRIGSEDGADANATFTRPSGLTRLSDGRIVVLEGSAPFLRWFDPAGKFLFGAARKGEGPGEFSSVSSLFRKRDDSVLVVGNPLFRSKTALFDSRGRMASEQIRLWEPIAKLGKWAECGGLQLSDGSRLLCQPIAGQPDDLERAGYFRKFNRIVRLSAGLDSILPMGRDGGIEQWSQDIGGGRFASVILPFAAVSRVAAGGTPLRIAIAENPAYNIEIWTPAGKLERIIRRPGSRVVPSVAAIAEERARIDARGRRGSIPVAQRPVPDSLPAVFRMVFAESGELWVSRIAPMKAYPYSSYDVFDKGGRFLGEIKFPAGVTLFEIGADYALGTRTNDDDVVLVEMYRLTKR